MYFSSKTQYRSLATSDLQVYLPETLSNCLLDTRHKEWQQRPYKRVISFRRIPLTVNWLPNFPLPFLPGAGCRFYRCPFYLSGCPNFRCPFYQLPIFPLPCFPWPKFPLLFFSVAVFTVCRLLNNQVNLSDSKNVLQIAKRQWEAYLLWIRSSSGDTWLQCKRSWVQVLAEDTENKWCAVKEFVNIYFT